MKTLSRSAMDFVKNCYGFSGLIAPAVTLLASLPSLLSASVSITVDLGGTSSEISPLVYGLNDWNRDSTTESTSFTLERMGGNRMTGYNWETNASNAGSDYIHHSDNNIVSSAAYSLQDVPGEGVMLSVNHAQSGDRPSLVTLQLAGYVAADMNGTVTEDQVAPSSRWKQVVINKGSALSLTPNTTDDYVYLDEQVNFLINKYGTAENGGVFAYSMDNEPALWSSTHSRLHPTQPTCAEIVSQNIAVCQMVKRLDPSAKTFGPALYGWSAFKTFQSATDWTSSLTTTYSWFISYYLSEMKAASDTAGERLLDVLDVHFYPEATGLNASSVATRITGDDSSTGVAAARVQAPRSLWDTTYLETSWIAVNEGIIRLIPRLQASVDTYYPDTKIAFTEYDYGGHNHYSGGLAQADVLGVYGRDGVYAACYWGNVEGYIIPAFQIFRNYDGNGSTFGDISISTTNPDAASYSTYASIDSATGTLHLIAINKTATEQAATISLANANGKVINSATVVGFSQASGSTLTSYSAVDSITNNSFSYTLPAYSVLHFVFASPTIDEDIAVKKGSSDSTVIIRFKTVYGKSYKLQSSADLNSWSNVGTTTYVGDGGVVEVEQTVASDPIFWRAVVVAE